MRNDLGIHPVFANASSDELGVLRTEVDDENGAARSHRHIVVRPADWGICPGKWNDGDVRTFRRLLLIVSIVFSLGANIAVASTPPDTTPPDSIVGHSITHDTVNDFMDLERDVTTCISSNPLPGCGREPTSPGDRGGWQQLLLFAIMLAGMSVIFVRVYFSVRSRDRSTN